MYDVVRVGADRAGELYELRRAALIEDPNAFLTTLAEHEARGPERFAARMRSGEADPLCAVFASEVDGTLVGMVGCTREDRPRVAHKAQVWGTWVAPAVRGHGAGRALMRVVIEHVRGVADVDLVQLRVAHTQAAARALYLDFGFRVYGREPRAMKLPDGSYLDEEYLSLELR